MLHDPQRQKYNNQKHVPLHEALGERKIIPEAE